MKYLCLIYDDESKRGTIPKDQMDTMMSEYYAFTESIKKSGQYIGVKNPRATIVWSLPAIEACTVPGKTRLGFKGKGHAAEMKRALGIPGHL